MLRKPVVLITGASGEIGHGLIESLAGDGSRQIITLDLRSLEPAIGAKVQHQYSGSILDTDLLERILAEYEVDLVFHLAALLSTRSEFTPTTAHTVNVDGTLKMLEFAQKEGESHGRPGHLPLSELHRRLRPPRCGHQGEGRQGPRGRVELPGHDVRLQQALLRAPRALLRRALQDAGPRVAVGARGLPQRALPRPHLRGDGAFGRDLGLRARDAARGGRGQALSLLRPSGHADPLHGHARRGRGALEAGRGAAREPDPARLQRRLLQPERRRDPRPGASRLSRAPTSPTRTTPSARPSSTPGPRTWTTPRRAATGASLRAIDEARAFDDYLMPTILKQYAACVGSEWLGRPGAPYGMPGQADVELEAVRVRSGEG